MEARSSTVACNRQGGWLLRQLKRESRTAAEVVMDEVLVINGGIDLIIADTQSQVQASKMERALHLAQRDLKQDPHFLSHVTRRKLHFQQLQNAVGGALPSVIRR